MRGERFSRDMSLRVFAHLLGQGLVNKTFNAFSEEAPYVAVRAGSSVPKSETLGNYVLRGAAPDHLGVDDLPCADATRDTPRVTTEPTGRPRRRKRRAERAAARKQSKAATKQLYLEMRANAEQSDEQGA